MPAPDSGRIFISYRRKENGWPARQLYRALSEVFGEDQVFKDVDSIEPGDNFVASVRSAVSACTVLLALIGPNWANLTDKQGRRRLDDPDDFVRLEIETALRRGIRVVPILVDDAEMPKSQDLPPRLTPLVSRQAITISPVTFDTSRLERTIRDAMKAAAAGAPESALPESPSRAVPDHPDWGSALRGAERQGNSLSTPPAGQPGPALRAKAALPRTGRVVVIALVLLISAAAWFVHLRTDSQRLDLPLGPAVSTTQLIVPRYKKLSPPGLLWLVDSVDPDSSRRLDTVQHGSAYSIAISPDRRTITYVDQGSAVRAMPAAGGTGRLLFDSPPGCGRINHKSWSTTDPSVFVLECQVGAGRRRLVVVDIDGTIIRELDTGGVQPSDPTISPDGSTIAFCGTLSDSSEEGGSIYVMPIDGSSEPEPVTDSPAEADSDPAWSPDGTSIAFRRRVGPPRGETFNSDNRLEDTDILTVAATGGPVRTLVSGPATDDKPSWSPDGRTIAFISNRDADGSRTETKDVWLVSPDGGQATPLGLSAPRYSTPTWSTR